MTTMKGGKPNRASLSLQLGFLTIHRKSPALLHISGNDTAFHLIQERNVHITAIAPHGIDLYIGDVAEEPRIPLGV